MLFVEDHARLLLVVHAVLGSALVAVSTHLVVWMRDLPRGRIRRIRGIRIFAVVSAGLFALSLLVGNAIYPVYKVRVRAEYLDQAGAVVRDLRDRLQVRQQVQSRYQSGVGTVAVPGGELSDRSILAQTAHLPRETAKIARWFDVKEHWVALGAALSCALMALLLVWNPKRHGTAIGSVAFLMALACALAAWLGAIIGLVVSSYRSIGGLG